MTQSYHNLYLAAVAAHPEKLKKNVQQETNVLWKDIKENKKNYNEELNRLKIKATRSKTSLLTYWATSRWGGGGGGVRKDDVIRGGGGGGSAKDDGGWRRGGGGLKSAKIGWRNMWTLPKL